MRQYDQERQQPRRYSSRNHLNPDDNFLSSLEIAHFPVAHDLIDYGV